MSARPARRVTTPDAGNTWRRIATGSLLAAAAAMLSTIASVATAVADDVPNAREAIEKARALERDGHAEDAETYLADLVAEENGPLADEAEVLLEAARMAGGADEARALAARSIAHTRSSDIVYAARMLRGDSYFVQGLYLTAAAEYEDAAGHAPGRRRGTADLMHATSVLASGDVESAVAAHEEMLGRLTLDDETRPEAELGLGTSLLAAGRAEEAAHRFEETAEAHPDHHLRVRALDGAARSFSALGDIPQAARVLEQLIESYPDSYEAVLAREELREFEPALSDTTEPVEADTLPETPAR
jgi:TolA-binding protein